MKITDLRKSKGYPRYTIICGGTQQERKDAPDRLLGQNDEFAGKMLDFFRKPPKRGFFGRKKCADELLAEMLRQTENLEKYKARDLINDLAEKEQGFGDAYKSAINWAAFILAKEFDLRKLFVRLPESLSEQQKACLTVTARIAAGCTQLVLSEALLGEKFVAFLCEELLTSTSSRLRKLFPEVTIVRITEKTEKEILEELTCLQKYCFTPGTDIMKNYRINSRVCLDHAADLYRMEGDILTNLHLCDLRQQVEKDRLSMREGWGERRRAAVSLRQEGLYQEAKESLKKLCEEGDGEAMVELAEIIREERTEESDLRYENLLIEADKQESATASYLRGCQVLEKELPDKMTDEDKIEAVEMAMYYFDKAADRGDIRGYYKNAQICASYTITKTKSTYNTWFSSTKGHQVRRVGFKEETLDKDNGKYYVNHLIDKAKDGNIEARLYLLELQQYYPEIDVVHGEYI